jgi:transposase
MLLRSTTYDPIFLEHLMHKIYHVTLTDEERTHLHDMITKGKAAARVQTHARILLKAERAPAGPAWTDEQISTALDVSRSTVERVRRTLVEDGLDAALYRRKSTTLRQRKLDGEQEAHLVTLACSEPPAGRDRWTLRLLADKLVDLHIVESIAPETVRQTLKKTTSNPGKKRNGASHQKPMQPS